LDERDKEEIFNKFSRDYLQRDRERDVSKKYINNNNNNYVLRININTKRRDPDLDRDLGLYLGQPQDHAMKTVKVSVIERHLKSESAVKVSNRDISK